MSPVELLELEIISNQNCIKTNKKQLRCKTIIVPFTELYNQEELREMLIKINKRKVRENRQLRKAIRILKKRVVLIESSPTVERGEFYRQYCIAGGIKKELKSGKI